MDLSQQLILVHKIKKIIILDLSLFFFFPPLLMRVSGENSSEVGIIKHTKAVRTRMGRGIVESNELKLFLIIH